MRIFLRRAPCAGILIYMALVDLIAVDFVEAGRAAARQGCRLCGALPRRAGHGHHRHLGVGC